MRICGKGPPTNTAETPLFCIGKVKKQLLFTENLRLRQGMGVIYLFPAVFCLFRLGIFWVDFGALRGKRKSPRGGLGGSFLVGRKVGFLRGRRPQARRRSRRHGRSPCVSTQSKRPAAVCLRFAKISGDIFCGFWSLGKLAKGLSAIVCFCATAGRENMKKPPWGLWVRAVTAAGCRGRGGSARR